MTRSFEETNPDLVLANYQYELPAERIADRPASPRHASRLLVYDQSEDRVVDSTFIKLAQFVPENSLLVLNQSRVYPCRLLGKKNTGGKCEVFILCLEAVNQTYRSLIRTGGKKHVGDEYHLAGGLVATLYAINDDGTFQLRFNVEDLPAALEQHAHVPIPPYIREGVSDPQDRQDYQTIFAKQSGSVAAPTAGLHFTEEVFSALKKRNIDIAYVTLHVGPGTFAPVKSEVITGHKMHTERYFVDQKNLKLLNSARKIIAVGTTTLRVLESAFDGQKFNLVPEQIYETDIFLYPGKPIRSIDGLITNFHLPGSSLLMLVAALVGREKVLELYREAIEKGYRFFSYGDAMLIKREGRL